MAYNPPIGIIYHLYTTYILPSGGLYATYHLLGEPETTIDVLLCSGSQNQRPHRLENSDPDLLSTRVSIEVTN